MSDQEKRNVLKKHLIEADIVEAIAERYVDILFERGVGSIEKLRKNLGRNESFLLELGFNDIDAEDIRDFLTFTNSPKQTASGKVLTRFR